MNNVTIMEPLEKLSPVQRATLLFHLFVAELPTFISFAKELTNSIIDNPGKLKEEAIDQMHSTDFWWELTNNANRVFDQYGDKLSQQSTLFIEELFNGYNSIYAVYCLHQYIQSEQCKNRKFKTAAMLFFF
jgi:hypothetical protein